MNHKLWYTLPLLFVVLMLTQPMSTMATTNTLYNDEITLSYDMQRCQFRYWYRDSETRHTLVLQSIQELDGTSIGRSLYLQEDKVDKFTLTQDAQQLQYHFDDYVNDLRANVYITVILRFNQVYIHVWIGTWDREKTGNQLRLAYTLDNSEVRYMSIDRDSCELSLTVTQTTALQEFWAWINNFSNLLALTLSIIALISSIFAWRRRGD